MHKLFENVEKELKNIEQNGLSSNNLDTAYKLASLGKNIKKMEKLDKEGEQMRERYMDGDYGARGGYRDYNDYGSRRYVIDSYDDGYGRRGVPGSGRGRYRDYGHERFYDHMDRIEEGLDMYSYGRERYRESGDANRMQEGLEKMMYGVCMFIESALDFAETPEEKEIIRKHIQKLKTK